MIRDDDTGWTEPTITINGHELTFAQAMTVRVAISNFGLFLSDSAVRRQIGERLADGYREHIGTLERAMRAPD